MAWVRCNSGWKPSRSGTAWSTGLSRRPGSRVERPDHSRPGVRIAAERRTHFLRPQLFLRPVHRDITIDGLAAFAARLYARMRRRPILVCNDPRPVAGKAGMVGVFSMSLDKSLKKGGGL